MTDPMNLPSRAGYQDPDFDDLKPMTTNQQRAYLKFFKDTNLCPPGHCIHETPGASRLLTFSSFSEFKSFFQLPVRPGNETAWETLVKHVGDKYSITVPALRRYAFYAIAGVHPLHPEALDHLDKMLRRNFSAQFFGGGNETVQPNAALRLHGRSLIANYGRLWLRPRSRVIVNAESCIMRVQDLSIDEPQADIIILEGMQGNAGRPGAKGKDGTDGKDGVNGYCSSCGIAEEGGSAGAPGADGAVGEDGKRGDNGGDSAMFSLFIDDLHGGDCYVAVVPGDGAKGGRGGDGGQGGKGGKGGTGRQCSATEKPAGDGGQGGNGGNGGNGARGGDAGRPQHVVIHYWSSDGSKLKVRTQTAHGGDGGQGGNPGHGGQGGTVTDAAPSMSAMGTPIRSGGRPGKPGQPGSLKGNAGQNGRDTGDATYTIIEWATQPTQTEGEPAVKNTIEK